MVFLYRQKQYLSLNTLFYTNSSDVSFDRITALKHVASVATASFV
jgi:hypothetical protein